MAEIVRVNRMYPGKDIFEKNGFTVSQSNGSYEFTLPENWELISLGKQSVHDFYQIFDDKNEFRGSYTITSDFGSLKMEIRLDKY